MTFPVVQAENQKGEDNDDTSGGAIGGAIEDLTDRQKEVLAIIKQDNKISYRAIADKLEINKSAVSKHIDLLKEKGHIERVGGTRGYWKVTTSNLD